MSRQRKSISVLMAMLLMLVTILSACSKSDTSNNTSPSVSGDEISKDPITLRMTVWGAPDEVAAYKVAIKKFETQYSNIKVDLQHIASDYDTKLTTMVAGNDVPDIAMMESGSIAFPLAEQGKFYNLQEFLEIDPDISTDKLIPNIMYSLEPGNVIGIAPGPESFGLFYNEDIFKEAGISPPPAKALEAWSWDEFVEIAKQLTIDNKGRTANDADFDAKNIKQYGVNASTWWGVYSNFIYSNGGDFVSEDGKTFGLNQPAAVEAIQKVSDLMNVHHVSPSPVQSKNIPATNVALQTKKVAMAIDGQWASTGLAQSKFNFNVGVLPVLKEPVTTVVAGMFSMFKSTKYPQESWELIKALLDPEASIDMITAGTWMPSYKEWYTDPALLAKWTENLDSRPSGYKDAIVEVILTNSHQTPTGYVKNFNKIMDIVNPALDKVWLGQQTAQEALDSIAAKAQEQVQGRRDIAQ
ncbi:sugar ABC transporter substrate-binding protein [Paenibacillus anaericanus]|uniref:Sugar ABC transporter substrate-binding protein n=1 Tax=Paenibacillus anaericanus TaxID=170367 RepID=A0A3S1C5I4_9BACL|nr:sugar ABC transporter substrate-binding protein [Paenibacillus anaericanus]RUT43424.1 sugar ABC transporter substrate-binding protein [Paenibacillus anaericanus]